MDSVIEFLTEMKNDVPLLVNDVGANAPNQRNLNKGINDLSGEVP